MDQPVRRCSFVAALMLAIAIAVGPAAAQGENKGSKDSPAAIATDAPRDVPSLELSRSQSEAIYQSISNQQAKKDTAPVG
ncbi:MAG TPA: hypothetical protein VN917_03585, partial [Xanthobacteraceae bacterium]|nr:hypothetical protein [Xanthobacteraceae bacterium]